MIVNKQESGIGVTIDLRGPEGNAFTVLGIAQQVCRKTHKKNRWDEIAQEAMSGDYDDLIKVIDREFGNYITFIK